jgi:hypothetical protein
MNITVFSNAHKYDWPTWFMGILRSFISGGSSAMVAGLTSMGIAPGTFNLTNSLSNTLKLMGVMFLFQGGYRMFEFLQLHGAPDKLQAALNAAGAANVQAGAAIQQAKEVAPMEARKKDDTV